jgi:hypothetical protein
LRRTDVCCRQFSQVQVACSVLVLLIAVPLMLHPNRHGFPPDAQLLVRNRK